MSNMGNVDSKEEDHVLQAMPSRASLSAMKMTPSSTPPRKDLPPAAANSVEKPYTRTSHSSTTPRAQVRTKPLKEKASPKIEVDPYDVLEIDPTLDEDVIKRAYRRMTLKHHPDKGGSNETFDLVTKCYIAILDHVEKTTYKEMDFQSLKHSASEVEQSIHGKRNRHIDHERFDPKFFNEMFTENRLPGPEDDGYGSIMQDSDRLADEQNIKINDRFKGNFNRNNFMNSFENEKLNDEHKDMVIYEEPQAMMSCNLPFQELGADRVEDFGETNRVHQSFCDYKKALSSGSKLIDPSLVERKKFNNVDHLKADRSNISYTLSPAEKKRLQTQQARAEQNEQSRLRRLHTRDNEYEKVYNRLNDFMIDHQDT